MAQRKNTEVRRKRRIKRVATVYAYRAIAILAAVLMVVGMISIISKITKCFHKDDQIQAAEKNIETSEICQEETEKETEEESATEYVKFKDKYSVDWDANDAYLLAKIAMAEAESESTEGKAMVIMVVLNRVFDSEFPGTIEEVIFQEENGTYQFSPVKPGGRWWSVEPDADCWKALRMIEIDGWDESEGALYFEATWNSRKWHKENLRYIKTIGNQNFYTRKKDE